MVLGKKVAIFDWAENPLFLYLKNSSLSLSSSSVVIYCNVFSILGMITENIRQLGSAHLKMYHRGNQLLSCQPRMIVM